MYTPRPRPPVTVVSTPENVIVHAAPRGSRLTRQQCLDLIDELTVAVGKLTGRDTP